MKPYYEEDGITIYHADCRDVLPTLPKVDLVLTDPPYGVGFKYASHDDTPIGYDEWCAEWFAMIKHNERIAIGCGMVNVQSWPKADWIICWHKPAAMGRCHVGFNNWEPVLLYGKAPKQIVDVFKAQILPDKSIDGHPCPKPLMWGKQLCEKLSVIGDTILDPFMGSGTTLVAAKQLGRKAIGIELEEKYCEIAVQRLRQGVLAL